MTDDRASSSNSRTSHEARHKTLLSSYDRYGNDKESEWVEENALRQSRKLVPAPSNIRGWICLGLVVAAASLSSAGAGYLLRPTCTKMECIRMTSGYSPALEAVELIDYQFQGEFSDQNVYKGHPRPELDAAWDRASALHEISMDSKFLPLWNKSDTAITYSEEQGGGHMVELEVFHQIHCLNLLRKMIYRDYDMQPEFKPAMFDVEPKLLYNHIDHCVDVTRQLIMCSGDVSPITANWVLTHHHPHPDFNTVHKCRNFDKLLEWAEEKDHGGVEFRPDSTLFPALQLSETILNHPLRAAGAEGTKQRP